MGKYVKLKVVSWGLGFCEMYDDFNKAKHDYFRLQDPKTMTGLGKDGKWHIIYTTEKKGK